MSTPRTSPGAAFRLPAGGWFLFGEPHAVVTAATTDGVKECLQRVERYVADGWHAAGFIGYEAAPAFDDALVAFPADSVPLVWFGIFRQPVAAAVLPAAADSAPVPEWRPSVTADEYADAVACIKTAIARGDTYQVNYTFRMHAPFTDDPWDYFRAVCRISPMPHASFIDTGRFRVCSFSPELFFSLDGTMLTVQPMKGTAPRGRCTAEDMRLMEELRRSGKERAENIMIVDMVRNDIGRIARSGTVQAPELCVTRRHPTVLQMISTITGETGAAFPDIMAALFPCASITGAPKIQASRIIRRLETTPRHVYCGAVGWYAPQRRACFNVAIRTVLVDTSERRAEYGTGSGIVWESGCGREFEECRLKAALVTAPSLPEFRLVETLLWNPDDGYFLLDRHIDRLLDSGGYFAYPVGEANVRTALDREAAAFGPQARRVRLTVDAGGEITVESSSPPPPAGGMITLQLVPDPVESGDRFLFHKTTFRKQYERARRRFPEVEDLLFMNERGELTETTTGNIVLELDGALFTPPVTCGLLAGVYRGHLLAEGRIRERVLTCEDLRHADRIIRINSVRREQECTLVG